MYWQESVKNERSMAVGIWALGASALIFAFVNTAKTDGSLRRVLEHPSLVHYFLAPTSWYLAPCDAYRAILCFAPDVSLQQSFMSTTRHRMQALSQDAADQGR